MIDPKGNIDDLFRESLSGFKSEPSPGVWRSIEKRFFGPLGSMIGIISLSVFLILLSIGISAWFRTTYNPDSLAILPQEDTTSYAMAGLSDHQAPVVMPASNVSQDNTYSFQSPEPKQNQEKDNNSITNQNDNNTSANNNNRAPSDEPSYRQQQLILAMNASGNTNYGASFNVSRTKTFGMNSLTAHSFDMLGKGSFSPVRREMTNPVDFQLKDSYAKPANIGFGAHFSPGVIFYDPNPSKKNISMDLTANYLQKRWLVQAGIGGNYMEDIGKYEINYSSLDSIGYYNEITSFEFDGNNPDSIIAYHTEKTVYDSVAHTYVSEKNNKYIYFTIPVHIGYRVFESRRFVTYLKGGLIYSMLVYKDEPTVDFQASDASVISINRQVPERTKHNVQFTAGIQFGYRFSDNFMLSLEPYYGQYLNSVYETGNGSSSDKPFVIGIRTGIDFNLK